MLRVIALGLALMLSLGAIIPLATGYTEASQKHHHKKTKKYRKYSKAWWRWYHQKQRQKKALASRRRSLQKRQEMLAQQGDDNSGQAQVAAKVGGKLGKSRQKVVAQDNSPAMLPSGDAAPAGWKRGQDTSSELQFRVDDDGGNQIGSAALAVVGPATGTDSDGVRNKTVGGVSTSSLRRTVIDRMMKEKGWVVNDYQKDVNGKKVYVVVAQSEGAMGQVQSRLFYFTEVEGKIYSLSTNAPNAASERLASESEKVLNSLQRGSQPTQSAELH